MESKFNPKPLISLLLVEDEPGTLELLITILTMKYPDVVLHTASNGKTGLELFQAHTPDIVMTDINLPVMSGLQMIDKIKTIKPDAMIIVLTADTGKAILENAISKGFEIDHFIAKPVVFEQLFAAIEQCIGVIAKQS